MLKKLQAKRLSALLVDGKIKTEVLAFNPENIAYIYNAVGYDAVDELELGELYPNVENAFQICLKMRDGATIVLWWRTNTAFLIERGMLADRAKAYGKEADESIEEEALELEFAYADEIIDKLAPVWIDL